MCHKFFLIHCLGDVHLNQPLIALGDCKCSVVPCYPHPRMCSTSVQTPKLTTTHHEKGIFTIMMIQTVRLIQKHTLNDLFSRFIHRDSPPTPHCPILVRHMRSRANNIIQNLSAIPHQSRTLKLGQRGGRKGTGWTCRQLVPVSY